MSLNIIYAGSIAYVSSSIPTLYLCVRRFYGIELDQLGSRNVGIANIFRHASKKAGYLAVLYLVILSIGNLLLAEYLFSIDGDRLYVVFLALILGNAYPLFGLFPGSKARTVILWSQLYLNPLVVLLYAVVWGLVYFLTKRSRAGALAVSIAYPILLYLVERAPIPVVCALVASLVLLPKNSRERDDFAYLQEGD